jgi:hypothetical protein
MSHGGLPTARLIGVAAWQDSEDYDGVGAWSRAKTDSPLTNTKTPFVVGSLQFADVSLGRVSDQVVQRFEDTLALANTKLP